MTRVIDGFQDPIFANLLFCEQDVAGQMFIAALGKNGKGTEVYQYDPWKRTTTLILTTGTYYTGMLYVSYYDGYLYCCGGNQDGKSATVSDRVPGWSVHPALQKQGLT